MTVETANLPDLEIEKLSPPLNRVLITSEDQFIFIEDFISRCDTFGWDLETNMCESLFDRKIRTITIGNREEQYIIDLLLLAGSTEALMQQGNWAAPAWAAGLVRLLNRILNSRNFLKVGYHLQFDYEVTKWCLGVRSFNFFDCFLAEQVIHCGMVHFKSKDFWALDDAVRRYMRLNIRKDLQKSFDLETPLTSDQLDYCALDVRLPMNIRAAQLKVGEKDGLLTTMHIENAALGAFGDMHASGFYMDTQAWTDLFNLTQTQHEKNLEKLDIEFGKVVGFWEELLPQLEVESVAAEKLWRETSDKERRPQYRKDYYAARRRYREIKDQLDDGKFEGRAAINYGSPKQILDTLKQLGVSVTDTDDTTLEKYAPYDEKKNVYLGNKAVGALRAYRETQKKLGTYGEEFLKHVDPISGRIHSDISQIGAATGRTSSSNPNLQNIPQDEAYRACFRAQKPGYVLITIDMSGAELRIIADMSGYKVWIDAFNNNWDVHSIGAEMMHPEEWKAGTEPGCAYYAIDEKTGKQKYEKCKCKVHKEIRNDNKAVNFGVAYGMDVPGLSLKIKKAADYCKKLLKNWRTVNAPVQRFLDNLGLSAKQSLEARTAIGRRRGFPRPTWEKAKEKAYEHWKKQCKKRGKELAPITERDFSKSLAMMYGSIERQGKNTPIQGGNGDIAKIAMGAGYDPDGKPFMWHLLPEYGAFPVGFVHDEFIVECPADNAQACLEMIGDCIRRAGKMVLKHVTMEFEGGISPVWKK